MPSISIPSAAVIADVGAGLSAIGTLGGGIAAGQAAAYRGAVASQNAAIARQNSAYAAEAGATKVEQVGMRAAQQESMVTAGMAANGVSTNSGSAATTQIGQRELGSLDELSAASEAARQVYSYETQERSFAGQAQLDEAEAVADPIEGTLAAGGNLLSSISKTSLLSSGPQLPPTHRWLYSPNNPTTANQLWGIDEG